MKRKAMSGRKIFPIPSELAPDAGKNSKVARVRLFFGKSDRNSLPEIGECVTIPKIIKKIA
ncbi:MAG: hypothetical protein JOZ33_09125 [Acidobacteriaceae bacterium]|nr:hypothetical protein [Acidobacteriaceae bacterium]